MAWLSQSSKAGAPSRVHSSALVWSMGFKIGHIEYGSMLDGWQQKGRNLVGSLRENHRHHTRYFHKTGKEGQ